MLTFFLIDDDEDDHELFQIALEAAEPSVNCVTAVNGQQGLTMLRNKAVEPDFIFLDLNMPLMGGKECLAELKKDKHLSQIPVVIFSTSSDPRDREETSLLGAIDFMTKPSKIYELTAVLKDFLGRLKN